MKGKQDEAVGKVFIVVGGMRRCLICERVFTPRKAAAHAVVVCRHQQRIVSVTEPIARRNENGK